MGCLLPVCSGSLWEPGRELGYPKKIRWGGNGGGGNGVRNHSSHPRTSSKTGDAHYVFRFRNHATSSRGKNGVRNHFSGARCPARCFPIRIVQQPAQPISPNHTVGLSLSQSGYSQFLPSLAIGSATPGNGAVLPWATGSAAFFAFRFRPVGRERWTTASGVAQSCSAFWNYSAAFMFSQHPQNNITIYEPQSRANAAQLCATPLPRLLGWLAKNVVLKVLRNGQSCTNWHEKRRALLCASPRHPGTGVIWKISGNGIALNSKTVKVYRPECAISCILRDDRNQTCVHEHNLIPFGMCCL